MKKIQKLISIFFGGFIVALFIFIGVKDMSFSIWLSPDTPETYSMQGADNREVQFIILPENKVLLIYADPQQIEYVLTEMRGTFGHHYIGPIWRLELAHSWSHSPFGGNIFGLRIYKSDIEPIEMEIKVLNKFHMGIGESRSLQIGSTSYEIILKGKDKIKFAGRWFKKVNNDTELIDSALRTLSAR